MDAVAKNLSDGLSTSYDSLSIIRSNDNPAVDYWHKKTESYQPSCDSDLLSLAAMVLQPALDVQMRCSKAGQSYERLKLQTILQMRSIWH